MSTRILPVLNFNFRMSELRRRLQPPVPSTEGETAVRRTTNTTAATSDPPPSQPQNVGLLPQPLPSRAVRRNLFGPIDHNESNKFVQEELGKIAVADAKRWNFDFQKDKPLEGRFNWELTAKEKVPSAYDMPGLITRLTASVPSSSKPLTTTVRQPLPSTSSKDSDVIIPIPIYKSTSSEPVEPLKDTMTQVTTALTTVVCSTAKTKEITATDTNIITNKERQSILPLRQSHMTDFLRVCKRPHPSSLEPANKLEPDDTPALKRARRTST